MSSPPPPDLVAAPRLLRTLLRVALAGILVIWSLLLLAWLAVHWVILPNIDAWRPMLQREASAALGLDVRIGRIQVRSGGWVPALELHDLRVLDAGAREALHLARVHIALAPQSLLRFRLQFQQVLVDDAQLEVRRDLAGRIFVAGIDLSKDDAGDDPRAREWLFEQRELVLRNAELRWVDERRDAEPLLLTQVDLVLRNGLRRHALRIDATPPPHWGERWSLRGRFTQPLLARAGDWRRWDGVLYAELPRADLGELRRHASLPFELGEGDGALRGWVELRQGVPREATLDLALRTVSMRLAPTLDMLHVEQLRGRLDATRQADGVSVRAHELSFVTGDALQWPVSNLRVSWQQRQDLASVLPSTQPVTGGEIDADRLDLAVMARTAERLPIGAPLRKLLDELAPQGRVEALQASWSGPLDTPSAYRVAAQLDKLHIGSAAPVGAGAVARPALHDARVRLSADQSGGQAQLLLEPGTLVLPGVWQQPAVAFERLDAQLAWRIEPRAGAAPRIEVQVKQARFANADAQGEFEARWHTGDGSGVARGGRYPGVLELTGRLERGRADRVARYMPVGLGERARSYVQHAVRSGHIDAASFAVRGDLWAFPFNDSRDTGAFQMKAQLRDVDFAYIPSEPGSAAAPAWESPWPGFSRVHGEIEFDKLQLKLNRLGGRLGDVELAEVQGGIADLSAPVLKVEGQARGPAAELLRFVQATPVAGWVGPVVAPITATGAAELKLGLNIPLAQPERAQVRGSVTLAGSDLRLRPGVPLLQAVRGRLDFSQQGFTVQGASAKVFGGELRFDGGSGADGALRFSGQGSAQAAALRQLSEWPALAEAAALLRGQAGYRLNLGLVRGRPELELTSNLVGMQIDLPAPLAKPAEASWPLRVHTQLLADSAGAPLRDVLQFELGELLKASYQRDLSGDRPVVLRGGLALRDTLPQPARGVQANLNLGRFDLDAWQRRFERGAGTLAGGVDGAYGPNGAGYLPQSLSLRADELHAGSRRLSNLVATVQVSQRGSERLWRANVNADQLSGNIDYLQPRSASQPGRVLARLERLSLPPSDAAAVEDLLGNAPASMPALDLVVADFELRGRKLGRLEVEAVNRPVAARAGGNEWQLDKLNLVTPEARLSATGRWIAGGRSRMAMDFQLDLADSGAFAERLGAGPALRGGKGTVHGALGWDGSPLSLSTASLDGRLKVALESGQFLHAEPGGARFLSVLSLRALPRRLLLDFRDVFDDGFAFDSVAGDIDVAAGVASTRNLRMTGVQASVLMQGSADLRNETQDLQVVVVPNFDASGAALATMVINPAIGLGTLVAQWLLREPLAAANTRVFQVTGAWSDPQVRSVDHKPPAEAPGAKKEGPT